MFSACDGTSINKCIVRNNTHAFLLPDKQKEKITQNWS